MPYDKPSDFLMDYLVNAGFDAIVELGSGYGKNLIELFFKGGPKDTPYYAGEYSKSGTEFAETLAGLNDKMNLTPFRFDHNNPDLSIVREKGRVFFFTCHSIEQVQYLREDYFKILASHGEHVVGIHFEPFGFQLQDSLPSELDTVQKVWFEDKRWNVNFAEVLQESAARGEIELTFLAKNIFGGVDPNSPTSIAIWQSKSG